jgi:hypothetical protein
MAIAAVALLKTQLVQWVGDFRWQSASWWTNAEPSTTKA